jgi:FdrA protein
MFVADSNAQAIRLTAAVLGAPKPASVANSLPAGSVEGAAPSFPQTQHTASAIPTHLPALLTTGPRVINLGLEHFATQLAMQDVPVVHVDWRPPAGGDPRLASLLARLR